jgi:RNA polymerase sigma-70 factor, ECF subfamily
MMVALRRERGMRREEIEHLFRSEGGRVLATLIRLVGDFELAEEMLQEAFAAALEQWSALPDNPRAWLVNVGRHKAIDRIRRQMRLRAKRPYLQAEAALAGHVLPLEPDDDSVSDDMLRLIFICCHPALNMETRVALTLRAVCGLTTEAVARAFLVSEDAMAQRLVRAKAKIRGARIPYETPDADRLDERLEGVLAVIYLVFSEGYAGTSGESLTREDLSREAIRLARLLDELLPGRPEIAGLLALMLLHDARRPARASVDGDIVLLEDQDRSLWDQTQIGEGLRLVERALLTPGRPSS